MRVLLPASQAPAPPPPPSSPAPTDLSPAPSPALDQPAAERLLAAAASWSVALPVVLVCIGVLCWSIYFRLATSERLLRVHARTVQSSPETNRPVTFEQVQAMRTQVQERSAALIKTRKGIPPLLSRLDARARELGWRCEASLKPPVTAPGGVRELTSHPVSIDLRYDSVQPERAYHHLLAWLWMVSTLEPRAEINALRLQSLGHGVNAAQVELNFFSVNSHAEPPPK